MTTTRTVASALSRARASLAVFASAFAVCAPTASFATNTDYALINVFNQPDLRVMDVTNMTVTTIPTPVTVLNGLSLGAIPGAIVANPSSTKAYFIEQWGTGWVPPQFDKVDELDMTTMSITRSWTMVDNISNGLAIDSAAGRIFYSEPSFGRNAVNVVDMASGATLGTIAVGRNPSRIILNSSATRAYVLNPTDDSISIIDATNYLVLATIAFGGNQYNTGFFALDPTGARLYVAHSGTNTVSVIDTTTNAVISTIDSSTLGGITLSSLAEVAVSPNGAQLWVTDTNGYAVYVIDTTTHALITTISLPGVPDGVAFNAAGTRAVVRQGGLSPGMAVIDTTTYAVANLPLGGNIAAGANYVVTGPVLSAPSITSANNTTFTVNAAGTFTITATGGPAPALALSGTLPSGVTFTGGTGVLAGTPALGTVGTYALTAGATNGILPNASQAFTLTVAKASQTISFTGPAAQTLGAGPITVSATASSGLSVSFTSSTSSVCTVSGTSVTLVSAGTCTINANQAGDANYNAAIAVQQSFSVASGVVTPPPLPPGATVPGAPIIGVATPGDSQATIAFSPPTSDGGVSILWYTVTCTPGPMRSSASASPITLTGLANGATYSCSVTATNMVGTGPASGTVSVTPIIPQYALSITKSGSGTGVVASRPAGISCGTACMASFGAGALIVLNATPDAGSIFAGWSGACSGTAACEVTMSGARSATATFTVSQFALSVSTAGTGSGTVISTPAGISCGTTCSASFATGTSVTLTPAAASGSTFAGWSGACTGTGTCTVAMTSAQSVSATFTLLPFALSVSTAGTGTGTVTSTPAGISCGTTCSASFNAGTSVTLTATPASGSIFAGWSGACTGTAACTVAMSAAQSVTATFALPSQFALSVNVANAPGIVSSSPPGIMCPPTCTASFAAGASVALTANSVDGSTLAGWSGACTGTGVCNVTMSSAQSVTATFLPLQFELSVITSGTGSGRIIGGGINCGPTCTASYSPGTTFNLSAFPAAGSTFTGWSGACSGTGICSVSMNASHSVAATFASTATSALAVTPSAIDFGIRLMGSTSPKARVNLTNTGTAALTITGATVSDAQFAVTSNCATVAVGATCALDVTFTPSLVDGPISTSAAATLSIASDALASPYKVSLVGVGAQSLLPYYYEVILKRVPEPGAAAYWNSQSVVPIANLGNDARPIFLGMAEIFFESYEYRAMQTSDKQFVTDLYGAFLGRGPDPGGLAYWTSTLNSSPRADLMAAIMFSDESRAFMRARYGDPVARPEYRWVMDFYRATGRPPDAAGFTYWLQRLQAAQCNAAPIAAVTAELNAMSVAFVNSVEYQLRGRSSAEYVSDLYNVLFDVAAGADVAYWTAKLDSGVVSRDDVRRQLMASPDFVFSEKSLATAGCVQ